MSTQRSLMGGILLTALAVALIRLTGNCTVAGGTARPTPLQPGLRW